MSKIKITDADFYLKQGHLKPRETPVVFLLQHEAAVSLAYTVDHYVFLQSSDRSQAVWQITDLGVPGAPVEDVVEAADALLSGEFASNRHLTGRLFAFEAESWSEDVMNEVIEVLIRARWPYEIAGKCGRAGLIPKDEWEAAIEAFDREIEANKAAARDRQRTTPSEVIETADRLGLAPEPCGDHPDKWQARCPGKSHPLYISAKEDRWFCGWCRRHGRSAELETFHAERQPQAS